MAAARREAAREEYQKYGELLGVLIHRPFGSVLTATVRRATGSVKGWLATTALVSWHLSTVAALAPTTKVGLGFDMLRYTYLEAPAKALWMFVSNTAPTWLVQTTIKLASVVYEKIKEMAKEAVDWAVKQLIRFVFRFFGLPEDLIEYLIASIPVQWIAIPATYLALTLGLIGPLLTIIQQVAAPILNLLRSVVTAVVQQVIFPFLRAARRYLFSGPSFIEQVERQMNLHPLSHRPFPLIHPDQDSLRKTSRDMIVNVGWSFSFLGALYAMFYRGEPRMQLIIHRRRPRPRTALVEIHPADTYNSRLNVIGQSFNVYHVDEFITRRAHGQGWRVQPVASRLFFAGGWGEEFEVEYPEAYIFAALERAIVADPFGAQAITCPDDMRGTNRDMAAKGIDKSRRGWQYHSTNKLWQWSSPLLRLSHRLGWDAGAGHELLEFAAALQLKLRVGHASEWLQPPTVTDRWYRAMVDSAKLELRLRTNVARLGLDPWFHAPWATSRRSRKWTEPNLLVLRNVPQQYGISSRGLGIVPETRDWLAFLLYVIDLSHVLEVAVELRVPVVPGPQFQPQLIANGLNDEIQAKLLETRALGAAYPNEEERNTLARSAQHLFRDVTAAGAPPIAKLTWPNLKCTAEGNEIVYRYLGPQWLPPAVEAATEAAPENQ